MTAEFTPLFPAVRAKVAAAANSGSQFAPMNASTSTASVQASAAIVPAFHRQGSPSGASDAHGNVSVEIKRDGDRISQIRIQCRCGELIELDCEY